MDVYRMVMADSYVLVGGAAAVSADQCGTNMEESTI